MRKKRILSIVMAVMMVITLLPSLVFAAAPAGELGGKLKIKGAAAVGSTLSADYGKAQPEGLTDDYVSFQWSRQISDEESTPVGSDKTYTVTSEDVGNKISLQVTGLEEMGVTGTLTAKSQEIKTTEEEAQEDTSEQIPEDEIIDETPEETMYDPDEDLQEIEGEELQKMDGEESEQGNGQENQINPEDEIQADGSKADSTDGKKDNEKQDTSPEEAVYMAEAEIEDGSQSLDFGLLEPGYEETEAQYVTIKNTGTGELNFSEISPEHFMVQDVEEPLQPGETATVWVQPREGLEEGEYTDTITYSSQEGAAASFEAKAAVAAEDLKVIDDPDAEDPDMQPVDGKEDGITPTPAADITEVPGEKEDDSQFSITADPTELKFTELAEGYENVTETQSVTITNGGTSAVTLVLPAPSFFELTPLAEGWDGTSGITLEHGESIVLNVQPAKGLKAAETPYEEEMNFGIVEDETVTAKITAAVTVTGEQPDISIKADPESYEFAKKEVGYTDPEQTTITLTNKGTADVTLVQPTAENFLVGLLSSETLAVGEQATFTLQPVKDLKAGMYEEKINVFIVGDETQEEVLPLTTVNAKFIVSAPEASYKLDVAPADLNFGNKETGYKNAPKAQNVTVTNNGNTDINLEQPVSENFEIGALSAAVIKAGESSTFTVAPKTGLKEGVYQESITIPNKEKVDAAVNVQFSVTKQTVKLTAVNKTADITGLKNGVKKSQKSLKLPSTVSIETTNGTMKANVNWDIKGCAYDVNNSEAQTFTVKGKVSLPEGIENPDEISLVTSVQVSVKGYRPKIPSTDENMITGIDVQHAYTTESKISFTAVGAGMDNTSPHAGDVRYVPANWTVIKTNTWDSAPYTATFGIVKAGTYTLSVVFDGQEYSKSGWVSTGKQDTKQLALTIKDAVSITATPTPIPAVTNANRKTAVQTGDTTNIMPFIIILIIAAGCIIGVVIYKKKK